MTAKAEAERAAWIEEILWQDLASALNRLSEWGVDPLRTVADRLGVNKVTDLDPSGRVHGGGVREGGWMLRYQPPFCPDPERPGHDLPSGWRAVERPA